MSRDPIDTIRSVVATEEQRLHAPFGADPRWGLLELVRSIDHYFYFFHSLLGEERRRERESERFHLNIYGQKKALSLFLERAASGQALLYPSLPGLQAWADPLIAQCGKVAYCDASLEMARYGLATIEQASLDAVKVTLSRELIGELFQNQQFDYIEQVIDQMDRDARRDLMRHRARIIGQMEPLVFVWKEEFIGYQTTPEIDTYYEHLAVLRARSWLALDAFPNDATFGGQSFDLFKAALVLLTSLALKHLDFAQLLWARTPTLELRNLLTIHEDRTALEQTLALALEVPSSAAKQALECFVLTPSNRAAHCSSPGAYSCPLIQFGEDAVLRSTAGLLANPVPFMLTELSRRYPNDWDRAVGMREAQFRKEVYDLFPEPRFKKLAFAVRIRASGGATATDVDATVFDVATGRLGLFQLKWQDHFGSSMRKRASLKRNFLKSANAWVDTMVRWMAESTPSAIAQHFGLSTEDVTSIHLFVIGRNWLQVQRSETDPRSAWGFWPRVVRLLAEEIHRSDVVGNLDLALRADSAPVADLMAKYQGPPDALVLGDLKILLQAQGP